LLTDHDAACRYCGHLLRGLDADDAWSHTVEGGVRVETDDRDSVARPAAVVRRAGGEISGVTKADHSEEAVDPLDFHDRSDVSRQQYSIEGQDEPRDTRRVVMLVISVALVVLIVVVLFVRSRGDEPSPEGTPVKVSWATLGTPVV
jgi:hypothetical protein